MIKIIIISTLLLLTPFSLNYSGMCLSKFRWLSDEERIILSIERIIKRENVAIETKHSGTQYFKQINYKSVDEFISKNPECCQINPKGGYDLPPPTLTSRILGGNSGDVVRIKFTAKYLDIYGENKTKVIKSDGVQTNCGRIHSN